MLNLISPIDYENDEKQYIDSLPKKTGDEWDSRTKKNSELKTKIRKYLQNTQGNRCAYCGFKLFVSSGDEIEHIAPKSKHPEFMYEPYNLVLACSRCNHSPLKGSKDTIDKKNSTYNKCLFNIIHPYFDDPEQFLVTEDNGLMCIKDNLSTNDNKRAEMTIRMFELNHSERVVQRRKDTADELFKSKYGVDALDYLLNISEYRRS